MADNDDIHPPPAPAGPGWAVCTGRRIRNSLILFSREGWICKTWEGEVAMVALPGAMPEMFPFTVRDETETVRRVTP